VTISEADAIRAYPELEVLRTIRDASWKFRPQLDESRELVGIDGWRDWPGGWRDAIGIMASTDAVAVRLVGGELVWDVSGTLSDVVAELLVLPASSDRTAPRLVVGAGPRCGRRNWGRTGHAPPGAVVSRPRAFAPGVLAACEESRTSDSLVHN
jgi:hypothetical protein